MIKKPFFLLWVLSVLLSACSHKRPETLPQTDQYAPVIPYGQDSLVIPFNIAPLNFCFDPESGIEKARIRIQPVTSEGKNLPPIRVRTGRSGTRIAIKKWKEALIRAKGGYLQVQVTARTGKQWCRYRPFIWRISPDPIDEYLLFRGSQFEEDLHDRVYTAVRNLTGFQTAAVIDNRLTGGNCMNCHDCLRHDASRMVVHIREQYAGTLIVQGDEVHKVKIPDNYQLRLTYPAWHPSGRYIAFSTNLPRSVHYSNATQKIIYTLDTLSNIIVLDVEKMRIFSCPELTREQDEAVFPAWSPDGRTLYFCSSPRKQYDSLPCDTCADPMRGFRQNRVEQIWADLMQMDFDPQTGVFSGLKCTFPFSEMHLSACMPKVTRDGRHVLVSLLKATTFPVQNLGDFYMLSLSDSSVREVRELNTEGSEKGHSFSSSGRWMVFSSSRRTQAVPETYITHYDSVSACFSPAFLVPQKRGDYYLTNLTGFVFPVLSTVAFALDARGMAREIRCPAKDLEVDTSLRKFLLKENERQLQGGH